jgi:hypothetical protein
MKNPIPFVRRRRRSFILGIPACSEVFETDVGTVRITRRVPVTQRGVRERAAPPNAARGFTRIELLVVIAYWFAWYAAFPATEVTTNLVY